MLSLISTSFSLISSNIKQDKKRISAYIPLIAIESIHGYRFRKIGSG